MFQIMLVLSLSQSSEWSASLSSRFLSLIYNAANQNFKSWIDERKDIEEIGLLQHYFLLNRHCRGDLRSSCYSEGASITVTIKTTLVKDSLEIMIDSKNDNLTKRGHLDVF